MKLLRPLQFSICLFFLTALSATLCAQDVPHYTLFTYSIINTNPAYSGAFEGTVRIGGHFRDQAFTMSPNTYVTPAFYADAPLFRGFGKQDWIGAGVTFFNDQAGTLELSHGGFLGSLSYHLAMDKDRKNVLTFAVQAGSMSRRLKTQELRLPDDVRDGTTGMGSTSQDAQRLGTDPSTSYFDLNAGLLFRSKISKQTNMNLGLAFKHILTPNYAFLGNNQTSQMNADSSTSDIPLRVTFHGDFSFQLNKKWALSPAFIANFAKSSETAVQFWVDHTLDPEKKKDQLLRFGLGYRLQDAAQVLVGYHTKRLRFALGYDLTLSDLKDAVNTFGGGIEFGASYILTIYKDPEIVPVIICPRF
ncbi:MAG: PorP/SprF family type IX secretion system membrane protein [Bacteroidota bacterium]